MDQNVFTLIFDCLGSVISVMQTVSFLGVSVFHWSIGFLIMAAVITYLVNTANSPYVESRSHARRRKGD